MTLNVQKTVAYVAVQDTYVPDLAIQKTAAYAAVQVPYNPAQSVQKAAAYVAVQTAPVESQNVEKVVAYVAVQAPYNPGQNVEKVVAYVGLLPDATGDAKQGTAADRPAYRAGPDPFVEFGAGESLQVNIVLPGTFTILTYRPDDTFTTETLTLPAGPYTLPAVNFNQVAIVSGTPSAIAMESIKLTMRTRAGNA